MNQTPSSTRWRHLGAFLILMTNLYGVVMFQKWLSGADVVYSTRDNISRLSRVELEDMVEDLQMELNARDDLPSNNNLRRKPADYESCSIYLAPSSVADSNNRPAGFGVFTTRRILPNEPIFPRGDGPVVPVPDVRRNSAASFAHDLFMPACAGMDIESNRSKYPRSSDCFESNINVGSLTNFHPMLVNVAADYEHVYKDNMLSRYADPGAGAFSYHLQEGWHAKRHIDAGEEIFTDYDEPWFFDHVLKKESKNIPHRKHFIEAAEVIGDFFHYKNVNQETFDEFRKSSTRHNKLTKRLIDRVAPSVEALKKLKESSLKFEATNPNYSRQFKLERAIGIKSTLQPDRDNDWIKENGRCLDNVYPKQSSLPQAGQGGFASRPLNKGTVIIPVPTLVQVMNIKHLNMYKQGESDPYSKQLLTNYCFGHKDSSMLLCPASQGNLINHCSMRMKTQVGQCNPAKGPNAILRWATGFDPETSEWLSQSMQTISERIKNGRRGLTLEVVATRNIAANEEIFIDYGPSWEEAWARHVASWSPPHNDGFKPVSDMNLNVDKYLLTEKELEKGAAYPHKNVRIGCYVSGAHLPCEILQKKTRSRNSTEYLVSIRKWDHEGEAERDHFGHFNWPYNDYNKARVKMRSDKIKFFAGPFSSDQYMEGTFRHPIGLPNRLWPKQWMNLKRPNPHLKLVIVALCVVGVTAALVKVNKKIYQVSPLVSSILLGLCTSFICLRLGLMIGNALADKDANS